MVFPQADATERVANPVRNLTGGRGFVEIYTESHEGPLPTAQYFERMEAILPGSASRIIALTEQALEEEAKDAAALRSLESRGLTFAFVIVMAVLLSGVFLIYSGKDVGGYTALLAALAILAALFIERKSHDKSDESESNGSS